MHPQWLDPGDPRQAFPPGHAALRDPNGLLAIGGDLSPRRVRQAYERGIFPWYDPNEPILWWCPDPRTVLPTDGMHVSRRLLRTILRADYAISFDRATEAVMLACAAPRRHGHGTWLGPEMRHAYLALHRLGFCHSIEVWRHGELVGGLYGIAIGRMFFGESMFSRENDCSKIALYWLCAQLRAWGMPLLDCQVGSPHLFRLGAVNLRRDDFLARLRPLVQAPAVDHWRLQIAAPADRRHLPPGR